MLFLLQVSGGVAAQGLSFSSYPGELASDDDFYMTSAQLVVLETTNHIYNFSILEVRCLVWPVRLWVCVDTCIYKVRTQWISVAWWVLETTNHIYNFSILEVRCSCGSGCAFVCVYMIPCQCEQLLHCSGHYVTLVLGTQSAARAFAWLETDAPLVGRLHCRPACRA